MTILELKKTIENLPDDMRVGSSGHYGEFLDWLYCGLKKVSKDRFKPCDEKIFAIYIESAGEEPD